MGITLRVYIDIKVFVNQTRPEKSYVCLGETGDHER